MFTRGMEGRDRSVIRKKWRNEGKRKEGKELLMEWKGGREVEYYREGTYGMEKEEMTWGYALFPPLPWVWKRPKMEDGRESTNIGGKERDKQG